MVKIIALGMTPAIWKNVFHHFRTCLPDVRFSAGMFSTPEELAYVQETATAPGAADDIADIVLAGVPAPSEMNARLALLSAWSELGVAQAFVLALPTLEHGLRSLVQGRTPVQLHLDKKANFTLTDPNLILKSFPAEFPRVRVNGYISALQPVNARKLLSLEQLQEGHLLGLGEIESVHQGEQAFSPATWIKQVLKSERIKLDAATPLALIRERRGVFLFPGIPVGRVQSVTLGPVRFSHLIDLGLMTESNPQFKAVLQVIGAADAHHGRIHAAFTRRLRHAEVRRDMPILCKADQPALAQSMEALLGGKGYRRVTCAAGADAARESALVLNLSGDPHDLAPAGKVKHLLFDVAAALRPSLASLDGLLDWRALTLSDSTHERVLISAKDFDAQCARLATRSKKAAAGLTLARNRHLLLRQQRDVLRSALTKLDTLLNAKDAVQVWSGELTQAVRQVLVLSHDQEEAGAVLQALPRISKKRWFDLSPFRDEDTLQNLKLEGLEEYRQGGLVIVTATSRERLAELHGRIAQESAEAERQLAENGEALTFYDGESGKIAAAERNLALDWIWSTLSAWFAEHEPHLLDAMGELRRSNERDWFHRRTVRRVYVIASNGMNRQSLLEACEEIYPTLGPDGAASFPYDLELPIQLGAAEKTALRERAQQEDLDSGDLKQMLRDALAEQIREAVEQYLDVLRSHLDGCEADVLIVEHPLQVATRVMDLLRHDQPALAQKPVICILPAYWAPEEGQPMPWPRTRVVLLRRMGALMASDCQGPLRAVYAT